MASWQTMCGNEMSQTRKRSENTNCCVASGSIVNETPYRAPMNHSMANGVISALNGHSIKEFLVFLLSNSLYLDCASRFEFLAEWPSILDTLVNHSTTHMTTVDFCVGLLTRSLMAEITGLVSRHSGWHFSARNAHAEQIKAFNMDKMTQKFESQALLM
jgi:hypothetical protein